MKWSVCLEFKNEQLAKIHEKPVVDPGFPIEGLQLLARLGFIKFVYQNERIGILRGLRAGCASLDPLQETCVTVWQMYFKIIIVSEILTITCRFPNALKLFVSKLVGS